MKDLPAIIVIGIIVILFLYFGYKDDFKRNPNHFLKTIIGIPVGMLSFIAGLPVISSLIKKWIKM